MTINSTAAILLCLYVAVAKKQGVSLDKLSGTIQNDILKEYIARGTYIYPVKQAMRIVTDIFAWCRETLPRWNSISISGYHIREAGSTAVQEVAFSLLRSCRFFLTPTTIYWKKLPSFGRRDVCGLRLCVSGFARKTRVPCCCDFTRKRRAPR